RTAVYPRSLHDALPICGSAERGLKPCVAISAVNQGAANVGAAYQQSREALLINARIDGGARVIAFESLGYLHTLYKAGAGALIRSEEHTSELQSRENLV